MTHKEPESVSERRERIARYDFRGLAEFVRFGTASDRYAGWIGQIYGDAYRDRVRGRNRKLGGQTFREEQVPIESVSEYFEHFEVLELDFTFYRPLLEADGRPGNNLGVLRNYADHAPERARFLLKVPQTYFVPQLRRGSGSETNPDYLNAEACNAHFLDPARRVLGDRLEGIVFEQSYVRQSDSPDPERNVAELDRFFRGLDRSAQAHIELRSEHLLTPGYFNWLAENGIGFVFSHWSWLPPIRVQWKMCGERFTAANRRVVSRLLTPLRVSYADAYAMTHPFEHPAPELEGADGTHRMVMDATALAYQGLLQGHTVDLILNNRAYGNSPALAQLIGGKILDEWEKRS